MSFPVFFLYAWRAELKMESKFEREVDGVGVLDILASEKARLVSDVLSRIESFKTFNKSRIEKHRPHLLTIRLLE